MTHSPLRVKSLFSAAALGIALFAASPVYAQSSAEISKMDLDKDGKVTRREFLTTMVDVFDKHAGAKGYCTADEIAKVKNDLDAIYGGRSVD